MLLELLCAAIAISRLLSIPSFTYLCSSCRRLMSKVILRTYCEVSRSSIRGVNGSASTPMACINERLGPIPVITSSGVQVVPSSFFPRRWHGPSLITEGRMLIIATQSQGVCLISASIARRAANTLRLSHFTVPFTQVG